MTAKKNGVQLPDAQQWNLPQPKAGFDFSKSQQVYAPAAKKQSYIIQSYIDAEKKKKGEGNKDNNKTAATQTTAAAPAVATTDQSDLLTLGTSQTTETRGGSTGTTTSSQTSNQTTHQTGASSQRTKLAAENDPDKVRLMGQTMSDINKGYNLDENGNFDTRTWQEMTGAKETEEQLKAREKAARQSMTATNLVNAFKALLTASGSAAGGLMPKVNIEDNKKNLEEIYTAQGLQQAERNRLAQTALASQQAAATARQQARLNIENMLAEKLGTTSQDGTTNGTTNGTQNTTQNTWQNGSTTGTTQQQKHDSAMYNLLIKAIDNGTITDEEARAAMKKLGIID